MRNGATVTPGEIGGGEGGDAMLCLVSRIEEEIKVLERRLREAVGAWPGVRGGREHREEEGEERNTHPYVDSLHPIQ